MTQLLYRTPWKVLGIGRSKFYELVAEGAITPVRIGRTLLVADEELRRFVATLASEGTTSHRS
jgi:excisionase family DNA binding protein